LFVLLLPIVGMQLSFLGWAGLGHELAHGTVFKKKALNRLLFIVFSILNWSNFNYYWRSHAAHHKYTLFKTFDGEVKPSAELNIPQLVGSLSFDVPYLWRSVRILMENAVGSIKGDWGKFLFPKDSLEREKVTKGAQIVLGAHLALILLFLVSQNISLLFLISFGPFFFTFPNKVLSLSQHYDKEVDNLDFRCNSRSISLPRFLRFLYANMNYHVEHHMYPAIPFYNLPLLNRELSQNFYLDPQPSLFAFLRKVFWRRRSKSILGKA